MEEGIVNSLCPKLQGLLAAVKFTARGLKFFLRLAVGSEDV